MSSLRDYAGQSLEWIQPYAFKSFFILQKGEEMLATASWEGKWTKNLVVAEAAGEQWLFKGQTMLDTEIKIYRGEERDFLKTAVPLASFEFNYKAERQELVLNDGRSFLWIWKRSATPTLTCMSPDGQQMLCIQTSGRRPLIHNLKEIVLEIEPYARDLPETPLLALLGFYIGRLALLSGERDLEHSPFAWLELLLGPWGA